MQVCLTCKWIWSASMHRARASVEDWHWLRVSTSSSMQPAWALAPAASTRCLSHVWQIDHQHQITMVSMSIAKIMVICTAVLRAVCVRSATSKQFTVLQPCSRALTVLSRLPYGSHVASLQRYSCCDFCNDVFMLSRDITSVAEPQEQVASHTGRRGHSQHGAQAL